MVLEDVAAELYGRAEVDAERLREGLVGVAAGENWPFATLAGLGRVEGT